MEEFSMNSLSDKQFLAIDSQAFLANRIIQNHPAGALEWISFEDLTSEYGNDYELAATGLRGHDGEGIVIVIDTEGNKTAYMFKEAE